MASKEVRIDVGDISGTGQRLAQAAEVFVPDEPGRSVAVLVCLAGGTYDRRYWDMPIPGYEGYSFAEHMRGLGYIVVTLDHLGVGQSDDPELPSVGLEILAAGDTAAVGYLQQELAAGHLVPGYALDLPFVGVGHSMGACLTTMVQARAGLFDALVLLGYGVEVSNVRDEVAVGLDLADRARESERLFRESTGAAPGSAYHVVPREPLRALFHAPDVPDEVIAADTQAQSRVPVAAAAQVTTPGMVASHASEIQVPIFLAFGATVDTSPAPRQEPKHYPRSPDITLYMLDNSGHCHNFASTRKLLWDRVSSWVPTVVPRRSRP